MTFDDLLMEMEEESNEPKYWFTDYKMTQIEKLHDYLHSLDEDRKSPIIRNNIKDWKIN